MSTKRVWVLLGIVVLCIAAGLGIWALLSAQSSDSSANNSSGAGDSTTAADATAVSISLPDYYSSGMVLQRDKPISIHGTISAEGAVTAERMTAQLTRKGVLPVTATVTIKGKDLTAEFPAVQGGLQPYQLTFSYGEKVVWEIDPVYIGDVFLTAGQSNMELNYAQYFASAAEKMNTVSDAYETSDLPKLVTDANIHFIVCDRSDETSRYPLIAQNRDGWLETNAANSKVLGYLPQLYAEQIRRHQPSIPVGIIQVAWGGTPISGHVKGGNIYKSHIAPLKGLRLAGILWYQGCSDAETLENALKYQSEFTAVINQYREVFADKDLPFLYVQLARYAVSPYTQIVRQAQLATLTSPDLGDAKNVAMTVAIDTDKGTSAVVHPLGKDILAARMAAQWEAMRVHKTVPNGPIAQKMERTGKGEATVTFVKGTADGLQTREPIYSLKATASHVSDPTSEPIQGVQVAGTDGKFVGAEARISGSQLIVSSDEVPHIRQVAYLWENNPQSSSLLYNGEDLPASPFVLGQ